MEIFSSSVIVSIIIFSIPRLFDRVEKNIMLFKGSNDESRQIFIEFSLFMYFILAHL